MNSTKQGRNSLVSAAVRPWVGPGLGAAKHLRDHLDPGLEPAAAPGSIRLQRPRRRGEDTEDLHQDHEQKRHLRHRHRRRARHKQAEREGCFTYVFDRLLLCRVGSESVHGGLVYM
jgi:hypothetical protein